MSASYSSRYPSGWNPPYQGPPPMPSGLNYTDKQWQTGYWSFNPAYNMQHQPSSQRPWIPNAAWYYTQQSSSSQHSQHSQHSQYPQQQPSSFNPFKKQIKPPSAEYLATKLVDNPLGLHDMIPAEELYKNGNKTAPEDTPWLWNPANLPPENDTPNGDASSTRRRSSSSDQANPSSSAIYSSGDRSARSKTDPTGASSSSSLAPHPPAPRDTYPFLNGSKQNDVHQRRPPETPPKQQQPNGTSTPGTAAASPGQPPQRKESFTAKRELRPTFSPNIIRTPEYYKSPPSTPSSGASGSREHSQGSVDSVTHRMERLGTGTGSSASSSPAPLTRHSSMPNYPLPSSSSSSISGVPAFSDEPTSMLSPLIGATPMASTRGVVDLPPVSSLSGSASFSSIYAPAKHSSLDTIVEASPQPTPSRHLQTSAPADFQASARSPTTPSKSSSKSPSRSRHRDASHAYYAQTQPHSASHSNSHTHTHTHSQPQSQSHSPHRRTPSRGPSPNHTPPTPAAGTPPSQETSSGSSNGSSSYRHVTPPSASTNAVHPESYSSPEPLPVPPPRECDVPVVPFEFHYIPMPPPPIQPGDKPPIRERRRKGFWNRRGDHVTSSGHLVYAPPDKAYPSELKEYPADGEAYKDDYGVIIAYNKDRPELPDSLPVRGQPPIKPYSSFVLYEYHDRRA